MTELTELGELEDEFNERMGELRRDEAGAALHNKVTVADFMLFVAVTAAICGVGIVMAVMS